MITFWIRGRGRIKDSLLWLGWFATNTVSRLPFCFPRIRVVPLSPKPSPSRHLSIHPSIMRVFLSFLLAAATASAFAPTVVHHKAAATTGTSTSTTQLHAIQRRDVLATAAAAVTSFVVFLADNNNNNAAQAATQAQSQRVSSSGSTWFFDEKIEQVREEAQLPTGGKIDLNNADVVSWLLCCWWWWLLSR